VLAPESPDRPATLGHLLAAWPDDDSRRAVLARTRRELLPFAGEALALGIPFRADGVTLPLEDPRIDDLIACAAADRRALPSAARIAAPGRGLGAWPRAAPATASAVQPSSQGSADPDADNAIAAHPDDADPEPAWSPADLRAALVGWAVGLPAGADLAAVTLAARERLAALRSPDARLTFATAHGTKGLEWDHVAVVGMTAGRFPSARALAEAPEPDRVLEEERRLAYVAWTRARRSLTLVYDPDAPSPFLREAFDPDELAPPPAAHRSRPSGAPAAA
jgi:hypothetical protein